jgi:hypothetical protein
MVIIEMPLFATNEHFFYSTLKVNVFKFFNYKNEWFNIRLFHYQATDTGGSIVVHLFGAVFGLTMSGALSLLDKKNYKSDLKAITTSDRSSNVFSMIGNIFRI